MRIQNPILMLVTLLLASTAVFAAPGGNSGADGVSLKYVPGSKFNGKVYVNGQTYAHEFGYFGPIHIQFKNNSYTGPLAEAVYNQADSKRHLNVFAAGLFQPARESMQFYTMLDVADGPLGGPENATLLPNGMGPEKALALDKLFGMYYPETITHEDPAHGAAFQAAIWEIIYETSGEYNVGDGDFIIDAEGEGDWWNLANYYLATYEEATQLANLMILTNDTYQDYIVMGTGQKTPITPVPEPITLAGLGLCVLGASGYLRRRMS
ncbi:MAG: PEP-CTERM sorting domain-containing protein [Phycisphaerales bacterium]|jgi:hypothetical protein|nr:PEP-CTERM sorting domain-containing protein [Phycisphaerales bacterium]MBT7171758.1 PEP-CTERM sorting domain-containing protein [Phycisphaerales bacterium]